MGKVKIDLYKRRVAYDRAFNLGTPKGVLNLLQNYHELRACRDAGDLEASVLLMDFHRIWDQKPLPPRQQLVIQYLYGLGLTKKETAEEMGISVPTVVGLEQKAIRKLARLIGGYE